MTTKSDEFVRGSVRDMVAAIQRRLRDSDVTTPEQATVLLTHLTALLGNIQREVRVADAEYNLVLLKCLDGEEAANRARIRAETSPEFMRKREARDAKELAVEMCRSLKYLIQAAKEEMRLQR